LNVKYPRLPPAVVVHALADARAAAAFGRPVTLLSAAGAALYTGIPWWQHLVVAIRRDRPGHDIHDILDCGDSPGLALEALRQGQSLIRLARGPAWDLVASRAAVAGASVLAARPPALDLARPGAAPALAAWLAVPPPDDRSLR
jgi:hypothetical protein